MKILHIISSPRGEDSFSIKLGNAIIEKLKGVHPGSSVNVHNLVTTPFPHLEEVHLRSFFTPAEQHTPELSAAVRHSDAAIAEVVEADIIVIGVPMYNFNIHSTLKAWIDHLARAHKTFRYGENGPEGLILGKKVYLAIATGGVYSEGPYKPFDFTEPYLRAVLGFMGMTDITAYRVEGISLPNLKDDALNIAIDKIDVSAEVVSVN